MVLEKFWQGTHQEENYGVEHDIRNTLADKERMEIDARSLFSRVRKVPLIVKWATAENRLTPDDSEEDSYIPLE